jgi:hypothetical protein
LGSGGTGSQTLFSSSMAQQAIAGSGSPRGIAVRARPTPYESARTTRARPVHQPRGLRALRLRAGFAQTKPVSPQVRRQRPPQGGRGPRADDAICRWCRGVLHNTRENTFRFVVCRNSIQNATALSVTGEQSPGTAKAGLDQGGASRHDARPAGSLFPSSEKSRTGSSIEVVW